MKVFRAALAIASTLLALVAMELVLRAQRADIIDFAGVHRPSIDPVLGYEMAPGARGSRNGTDIAINAAGFRDDEFPRGPKSEPRIVMLGDSVAWGWGVPMAGAFPQLLESELRAEPAGRFAGATVFNLAVDGYSTDQEIRLLETRGFGYEPDLIIITYVFNDPDVADGGLLHCFSTNCEVFELAKRCVRAASDRLHGHPREYHELVHARYRDEIAANFQRLGEIQRQHRVPIVIALCPIFQYEGSEYPLSKLHESIGEMCRSNALGFLDLYPAFASEDLAACSNDVWHPTAHGHRVIASAILAHLKDLKTPVAVKEK